MTDRTAFAAIGVVVTLLCASIDASADPPPANHRILNQPSAPVSIAYYTASYQSRGSYSREGIRHSVTYENVSERKIVALQFGLLSFDIFNEFQDRLGGYTIQDVEPGRLADGVWVASALAESAFYTGVAYVSKVRFVDGEVWSADLESITKQVQEIEAAFSVESLRSK